MPLTDQVRIEKEEVYELVDLMRASVRSEGALLEAAEAVEDAVYHAMPVALTDQVRLPRERVAELARDLGLAA